MVFLDSELTECKKWHCVDHQKTLAYNMKTEIRSKQSYILLDLNWYINVSREIEQICCGGGGKREGGKRERERRLVYYKTTRLGMGCPEIWLIVFLCVSVQGFPDRTSI